SDPKRTFVFRRLFAYCTRVGEKYFGDQPERSMYTVGLCRQTEMASSCHGNDGCAMMIGISGKSTATSSIGIGCPYFSLIPAPPRPPVPIPLWPVWNRTGSRAAEKISYNG